MTIEFYTTFYKRENSTKRPSDGFSSRTLTGHLRDACSVMHPIIDIEPAGTGQLLPYQYTYAYIPIFSRYYFVRDWRWNNGLWQVVMDEDILATWKTQIGVNTCYVLRHDSDTDYNENISDTAYPATTEIVTDTFPMFNTFAAGLADGCYIIGVIGNDPSNAVGAISYYALSHTALGTLKNQLLTNNNLVTMEFIDGGGQQLVTDIAPELVKVLYNPFQYIASCMWFPFGISAVEHMSDAVSTVALGWWSYQVPARRLYSTATQYGDAFTLRFGEYADPHFHPQLSRGWYLNHSPYTRRMICGRFGSVALDPAWYGQYDQIAVDYIVDLITGQCLVKIGSRQPDGDLAVYKWYREVHFVLGVPIQLAQIGVDYLGTAVSGINAVSDIAGSAVSGFLSGGITGAIGKTISSAANGIYNTLSAAMPQMETSGQNGSMLVAQHETLVINQFYLIVDEDIHHKGRPLCELRQLDTLSGFILCADGELDLYCLAEEKEAIARYLTSGFFWE